MHQFPYDVQLAILRLLSTRDVVRLCATCKALHRLMVDRSIWHHALFRLLLHFPWPHMSRRLLKMSVDELKQHVVLSARLDQMWHGLDYHPRRITNFNCSNEVEHINLVAGGNWLVIAMHDGSLRLHELGAPAPAVTLSHNLTGNESVFYLSARVALTHENEDMIILQLGVRYNECNIYVYHIAIVDPTPAFLLIGKISVIGSVWCCASGGQLLVYGLENGGGEMILNVCPVGPNYVDSHGPQVSMNIGPWSADEDFTITILSEHQLLLAYHGGLALYEIPPPSASSTSKPTKSDRAVPYSVAVQPVWSCRCDIGSGIYRISPFIWSTVTTEAGAHATPVRPLVIAGTRALHVLRVTADSAVDYREVPYPLTNGAEIEYMGLGAVGLRRAIWDCTEARNGSLNVHFRTYSLPRSILDLGEDDPDFGAVELGMRGKLGSFTVTLDPQEHLVSIGLEENSGRVCLLLNNITTGARRISIIDAA